MSGYALVDRRDVKTASVAATADGDNTVVAAVTGKRIVVVGYQLTSTTTAVATVKSGSTSLFALSMTAAVHVPYAGSAQAPAFATAAGEALVVSTTAGQDVTGHLAYYLA